MHRMDTNKDPTDNHHHMTGDKLLEDMDSGLEFGDTLHGRPAPEFRTLVEEELEWCFQSLKEDV